MVFYPVDSPKFLIENTNKVKLIRSLNLRNKVWSSKTLCEYLSISTEPISLENFILVVIELGPFFLFPLYFVAHGDLDISNIYYVI